jgi:endonuclease/exonuclease/phosphatase family metal-dependent hydrolase
MRLKVMTLNINSGHGSRGRFEDRIGRGVLLDNLGGIASLVRKADVALLQEVDIRWEGTHGINQAQEIMKRAGFGFSFWHPHMTSPSLGLLNAPAGGALLGRDIGTAILSRFPIVRGSSYDFGQSVCNPLLRFCARVLNEFKGFTHAVLETPAGPVSVISLHLLNDPLYALTNAMGRGVRGHTLQRIRQVRRLLGYARSLDTPLIMGGDFNMVPREAKLSFPECLNGDKDDYTTSLGVYLLREEGRLRTIPALSGRGRPEDIGAYHTYPSLGPDRTLDYLFATPELEFAGYEVLPDIVSDHRAVSAIVELRGA